MTRFPYPLDQGDKLRAYHQLKELSSYFDVHLICISDKTVSQDDKLKIAPLVKDLQVYELTRFGLIFGFLWSLIRNKPFQIGYFYRRAIKKKITHYLHKVRPSYVYAYLIRSAEYVKDYHDCPKGLDYMDSFSLNLYRRLSTSTGVKGFIVKEEWKRVKEYEEKIAYYFEDFFMISEEDIKHTPHIKKEVHVLENGISEDFILNDYATRAKDYDILFTGNMSYEPNHIAALFLINEVLPYLKDGIKTMIAGKSPQTELVKKQNINLTIPGFLEDLTEAYGNAKIFVAPMQTGSGLQNKILEAMAAGVPCVISDLTNQSLGAKDKEQAFICSTPQEYTHIVNELLRDEELRIKVGAAGQKFVLTSFSWQNSTKFLSSVLKNRIESH